MSPSSSAKDQSRWVTRRRLPAIVAVVLAMLGASLAAGTQMAVAAPSVSVGDLTTEHLVDPLGIDDEVPRLSWIVSAKHNGAEQSAYEIRVSSDDSMKGDVWRSGKVSSDQSFDVEYGGPALDSLTRYFWSVRVWDENGAPSAWSDRAWFETAFLDDTEFDGEWVGSGESTTPPAQTPEVLLRHDFELSNKQVRSARAYVAVAGLYQMFLNGERVGDRELDPAFTEYEDRIMYSTYDVTGLLRSKDANTVGVSLGRGWYTGYPAAKVQLDVQYRDGSTQRVMTGGDWMTSDGPTVQNSIQGETYDARLEQPGWADVGFDDGDWKAAAVMESPTAELDAQFVEPIRVMDELEVQATSSIDETTTLYDFEATKAGWATIRMSGPEGATARIEFGERLSQDGTINNGSIQNYDYTFKGDGTESFTPKYSYNGFRYVSIDVPDGVTVESVVGHTLNTDVASTGGFSSSNELYNRYHAAMRNSTLSNFHSIPTDTPMYEKRGWTADGYLFADSALLNFGSENLWEKWMLDHADSQNAQGQLPVWLPGTANPTDDPIWTASYIQINWDLYHYRGDTRVLAEHYDGMKLWLDRFEDLISATGYLYTGGTYGDHEPAGGGPGDPAPAEFPRTADNRAIGTAVIYLMARQLADIAGILGESGDEIEIDELADTIRSAYNEELYHPDEQLYRARPDEYRQTDNVVPLMFGLAPDGERAGICENLREDVEVEWEGHLDTGAVGTKWILPALTECGYTDLAEVVATNPTYPGWGWWFQTLDGYDNGVETFVVDGHWEAWCWFGARTADNCDIDPARSHNHAFRGTVDDWLFQYVAGIRATEAGYREISIAPVLVGSLDEASAVTTTPLGEVSSSWERSDGRLVLDVVIPVGATAVVEVPASDADSVTVPEGARRVGPTDGGVEFEVGSGEYHFEAEE